MQRSIPIPLAVNTADGYEAMFSNTLGVENAAVGALALYSNTTGSDNTALGEFALHLNTTGQNNTATGNAALQVNTTGYYNTATGENALASTATGSSNTAIGNRAGYNNTESWNTFIGDSAGYLNTFGEYNTYLGYISGNENSNITVSNSTFLGYQAGDGGTVTGNTVYIGNTSVANILGEVATGTYSDGRIKDNIKENVPGLDFISKLRPVTYNLNIHRQNSLMGIKNDEDWPGKYDIEKITQSGFIAQQVDSAAQACGYDFNGVIKPQNLDGLYALRYSEFVVPLVKAVQELNAKNDTIRIAVDSLRSLSTTVDSLRNAFKSI